MYLDNAKMPDNSFVVRKLSWFTSNPEDDHWRALERVMHYMASIKYYVIYYSGYATLLEGYIGANWISDIDELYATTRYVFTLGGAAVSWRSWKQTILMRFTMEAELTTLDKTTI
jgi:hypothetical protein